MSTEPNDQTPEGISVFMVDPILTRFKDWLHSQNLHLSGPMYFNEHDPEDATWFVNAGRSEEEFRDILNRVMEEGK